MIEHVHGSLHRLAFVFLFLITIVMAATVHAEPESGSSVPANISGLYYYLGGGPYLPPPGAYANSFNISARFKVGLGFSCGKFNFQDNIAQMINQMIDIPRQIPGQMTMMASAAIGGLPSYLLMKGSPYLYNLITKTLDEAANLFRLSYKSCKQIESELSRNPDANPYQSFMRASVADRWSIGSENGDLAADVDQSTKDNPGEPIRWLGDELYGTADNPIQVNRDIVIAGYNILIGRTGNVAVTDAPVGAMADQPIVKIWSSPAVAARWTQEVLGDTKIVLKNDNKPEAIPGRGLRPKVWELEETIYSALEKALEKDDYSDINDYTSTRISSALIESLRAMSPGEAAVMMDRLASELAVTEAREQMMLIKQMMITGLKAPDLVASTGGSVANEYIRGTSFPDMDRLIREIFDALDLKQRTVNRTTVTILNYIEQKDKAAASKRPVREDTGSNALDGAVEK